MQMEIGTTTFFRYANVLDHRWPIGRQWEPTKEQVTRTDCPEGIGGGHDKIVTHPGIGAWPGVWFRF